MRHLSEMSRPKNQDPRKFHMNFPWSPLEIPHNPWKFCMLFFKQSWKFYIFTTLPPIFSGIVQSRRSCASSNTALYSRMEITCHQLLIGFFHKLISMQDIVHDMLYLHVDQQLPQLYVHAPVSYHLVTNDNQC